VSYLPYVIDANPDDLAQAAFDSWAAQYPGWVPAQGNVEVVQMRALAAMIAELMSVAADVPASVFRAWGPFVGIYPIEAVSAQISVTIATTTGYPPQIAAGTQFAIVDPTGQQTAWVLAASTTLAASPVAATLIAVQPGAAQNAYPATSTIQLVDTVDPLGVSLVGVGAVVATSVSTGGLDAETDDAYQARLSSELTLLAPRPILPVDFAILALSRPDISPVFRALAIDTYDPGTANGGTSAGPATGISRCVTVVVMDASGGAPSGIASLATWLDSLREINFQVFVMARILATVYVSYTVKALAGYATTDVQTAVNQAIEGYLSPLGFGVPPDAGAVTAGWVAQPLVRYQDVSAIISGTPGVDYYSALTIGTAASPTGTVDVTLDTVGATVPTTATSGGGWTDVGASIVGTVS